MQVMPLLGLELAASRTMQWGGSGSAGIVELAGQGGVRI
jgi:hypothetical protein